MPKLTGNRILAFVAVGMAVIGLGGIVAVLLINGANITNATSWVGLFGFLAVLTTVAVNSLQIARLLRQMGVFGDKINGHLRSHDQLMIEHIRLMQAVLGEDTKLIDHPAENGA